jgi:hypothetical protein
MNEREMILSGNSDALDALYKRHIANKQELLALRKANRELAFDLATVQLKTACDIASLVMNESDKCTQDIFFLIYEKYNLSRNDIDVYSYDVMRKLMHGKDISSDPNDNV